MSSDSLSYPAPLRARRLRLASPILERLRARPELLGVLGVAASLNLWGLSINGWANTYYSAAVRSMSTSWHDFLFISLDRSGLMTVDKPPLSLWVQALSARVFGFHPLSLLVPQAVMGVIAAGLTYDLTRRRFGRAAGFVAGIALATTPVVVAISRHNNPDELLTLCCVAALWLASRALDTGRTRWLVLSGIAVGLGFETKMGVALLVVPGIVAAYLWVAPQGRLRALGQLLGGGAVMAAVALAWPLLVTLTPAADRPWISGTADNSIWSLIFNYNGLGRLAGQAGGPQAFGGGGSAFGGPAGAFRLLGSALGNQAGWLLGFALVAGLGLIVSSRLRRSDPRTGWLILVGGAFATTAVAFSIAGGIFHPYYLAFLAPFTAALLGAGVAQMLGSGGSARVIAPLAIAAGIVTELIVLGELGGALAWAKPLLIVAGACAVLLGLTLTPRVRAGVAIVAVLVLLAAPAAWAVQTMGHATSSTFPAGGPADALAIGGSAGAPGGSGSGRGGLGFGGLGQPPRLGGSGSRRAPPTARAAAVSAVVDVRGLWRAARRRAGRLRRQQRHADRDRALRPGSWRRHDRRPKPELGSGGDRPLRRQRSRPRRVLRPRELGHGPVDRDGGQGGAPALGAHGRHRKPSGSGRAARRKSGGDGRGGGGLQGRSKSPPGAPTLTIYDCQGRAREILAASASKGSDR